jgi:DNA (cytosine-5)-methyltransferase 1
MNELALFAGAGGGILGGKLLGWRTVCAVEWEPYPASVLCARQNDGLLPPFPIWDDVQTFDGHPWRGIVDVISGGFPCQDISAAGKGVGIDGERSGMWGEMARIIREVRPRFVFVENSPMLTSRGLGRVLGDLASMGFDARWGVLGAADVGANHQRDRIWIVAKWRGQLPHAQHDRIRRWEQQQTSLTQEDGKATNSASHRSQEQANERILESQGRSEFQLGEPRDTREMAYAQCEGLEGQPRNEFIQECGASIDSSGGISAIGSKQWWSIEPNVGRVAHGVACRVDRLKAIGNGQVPLCAATAWRVLNAWGS